MIPDAHPLRGCPVAVVDVETTGLEAGTCHVVQVAVVHIDSLGDTPPALVFNSLVKPPAPIPEELSRIHGITDETVVAAPAWAELADQVHELLGGRLLCGYNLPFDIGFLNAEMGRAGKRWLQPRGLDPLVWARALDVDQTCTLGAVAKRRGVTFRTHEADADALTTARLLPGLLRELGRGGHCPGAVLHSVGAFLGWQTRTALAQEAPPDKYSRRWHEALGIEPARTPSAETSTCRSCSAPIVWGTTRAGKRVPLDPELVTVTLCANARPAARRELLITPDGGSVSGAVLPADDAPELPRVAGRRSHFATCPNAARHRKTA